MNNFNTEIEKIAKHHRRAPIFDGVVSEKDYQESDIKILWVLKEANSSGENNSWDMREHIKNKLKTDTGIFKGWSSTFKKIIYVTNAILNNLSWNDELYHPSYKPEVIDNLKKIAYINIKKTGGGSSANHKEIQTYYEFSKTLLHNQIKEFSPNIIIFGGTFKFFQNDFDLEFDDFGSCKATNHQGTLFISAYHPMYPFKEETYVKDILTAVRKFSK
jgi:hypothetical protein